MKDNVTNAMLKTAKVMAYKTRARLALNTIGQVIVARYIIAGRNFGARARTFGGIDENIRYGSCDGTIMRSETE